MQIEASVVEADIAKVKDGQKVRFAVDSYPDEFFEGVVTQVRNEAITTSNVVSYTVVIGIDNTSMKLRPGMTANVEIITSEAKGIMAVPNQALRFYMDDGEGVKRYADRGIWVLKGRTPERISVEIGVSDDSNTQVISNQLSVGDKVILSKSDAEVTKQMRLRMPRR